MKYINELKDGDRIADIYLVKSKQSATTRNGKAYENVALQDKTGVIDAKIWEPGDPGIGEFEVLDYVDVYGEVTTFNNALQVNIRRARKCREGEYDPANYVPVSSKNRDEMFKELTAIMGTIGNLHLKGLLRAFFIEDEDFRKAFCRSSAAKSVHHAFMGGLLEHTLSVAKLCSYLCEAYPALNRDLLVTAAILHDIGKVREFSEFPENDYTDDGQFIGHIVMGSEMVSERIKTLETPFPPVLEKELKHCILAHHGKLEFGSPKKPAIIEAVALHMADDMDAKMESFTEELNSAQGGGWLGFNKLFESNLFYTQVS